MGRPRVLLDTNILVSGIAFKKGNEHQILRLAERGRITLVLPETVLMEAKEVLMKKFRGFEKLLDIFVTNIRFESVSVRDVLSKVETYTGMVRDTKDVSILTAVALAEPDYVVTGDKILRLDLKDSSDIMENTKVCSSIEFLRYFQGQF